MDERCFLEPLELIIVDIVCNSNGKADTSCMMQACMHLETLNKLIEKSSSLLTEIVGAGLSQEITLRLLIYAERSDLN